METTIDLLEGELVVADAARFMDKLHPGWHHNINIETLAMIDAQRCVAGQNGLNWQTVSKAYAHTVGIRVLDAEAVFAQYREQWVEEIRKR